MHVVCKISFVVIIFLMCAYLYLFTGFVMFWPGLVSVARRSFSSCGPRGLLVVVASPVLEHGL